ncbi:Pyrrolo-quinoline quinone [Planctopirus limnophila DSM 3776]|uniref:Pyrrolo-quinoline quinone n=1 Tax=Planctopirus limnophila (strain ATCC 43296 / DSM 3776 / IFAM 1008 / Mu 290) TaxID=521674 RepID=D5SY51_PLAL2|nr:PQQ-binding-like beta-propeller repeat protein [Planctopirus limnophila]ADG69844.1 Pyrrolo-quinoline quinone [Planctopirus limnophila DSM 3776]
MLSLSSWSALSSTTAAILSGLLLIPTISAQADWPTFRGADRTAVAPDTGLLKEWPKEGPKLLWKAEGAGRGYSSLAVAGDKVFTLGDAPSVAEDKDEYLLAFNRADGKLLWKTKTGPAWNEGKESWQSSRSTPTVAGDDVFVLSPQGVLVACEAATGKEIWRKDLKAEFSGKKADSWGYSESVLVDGDRVIVTPGGPKTTMAALNRATGATIWTTVREDDRGAGHASIVPVTVGGVKVYVQTTGSGPLGVRANDGQLLWSYPIEKTTAVIPTPIVKNDLVFFAAGYKRGGALLKQVPGENETVKIEEVYPLNPRLANKHGGIILMGDYLYGDSDDAGIPYCADLMTGEVKWQGRGAGKGSVSVVGADGKAYWRFSDGMMVLSETGPEKYTEISSFQIPGSGDRPSWSHPVITDGKLYLREQDSILCYDLKP